MKGRAGEVSLSVVVVIIIVVAVVAAGAYFLIAERSTDNNSPEAPSPHMPQILIDSQDDVNVIWWQFSTNETDSDPNSSYPELWHMKLDDMGETLVEPHLLVRLAGSGAGIDGIFAEIDSNDIIHVAVGGQYLQLGTDGALLQDAAPLSDNELIPGHRVVMGSDDRPLYLGANGTIDDNNDIHVVWTEHLQGYGWEFYYAEYDLNGTLIHNATLISENVTHGSILCDSTGDLHLVCRGLNNSIQYGKLGNNGTVLVPIEPMDLGKLVTYGHACLDHEENIWLVFQGADGQNESFMKVDGDGAIALQPTVLDNAQGKGSISSIGSDSSGSLHLVMESGGNGGFYYFKVRSNGDVEVDGRQIYG